MPKPPTSMELSLVRSGDEILVSARGSRGEQTAPRSLGPARDVPAMLRFAAAVQEAAARRQPLAPALLAEAQAAHDALLDGETGKLHARLTEAAGGPLLVRLLVHDPELQAVPWEALCQPGEALGFWASSPDLLPVRGVSSSDPWLPREVRGAVRVLAIAPTGGDLATLKGALAERIASGEVEWLDPVEGPAARLPYLFDRLQREPTPHVLHFLGHGGLDQGAPALRLADDDGEETWLPVELLAQQLKATSRVALRLVVLEACEGARPSAFASAAEILARAGAFSVVAHLWPVKADVARTFSAQLYRALAGAESGGDIALALNEARRAVLGAHQGSAETFSPVAYLRGPDGWLFDFKGRKVAPPTARASLGGATAALDPALARLLGAPFSLVLGDQGEGERTALDALAARLGKALVKAEDPAPVGLPLSALAQRFAFHRSHDDLAEALQEALPAAASPPLLAALTRFARPGVHVTLLRRPLFEQALAERWPSLRLHVLQARAAGAGLYCREPDGSWERLEEPPGTLELDRELVVLRLNGGVTPKQAYMPTLVTEDDHLSAPRDLAATLPDHLAYAILSGLQNKDRPALLLGLSLLSWDHRVLLHRLFGERGLPDRSLVVLDPGGRERAFWEKGKGLPGHRGVTVVEARPDALAALLQELPGPDQAVAPPAVLSPRPPTPTLASLRQLLSAVLRSDSDFDAFALDHFRDTYGHFARGQTTVEKTTLLLQREDPATILKRLQEQDPPAVARYEALLRYEP